MFFQNLLGCFLTCGDLLHVPNEGRLLDFEKKVSQENGVNMMVRLLGVPEAVEVKVCNDEYNVHITYNTLKWLYQEHLIVARRLEVPQSREELQERERMRQCCIRSFMLYLVVCMLFANKTKINIELIYLEAMVDLNRVNRWSWEGMTLAHLYHYLTDFVRPGMKTMDGCVTLLMIINLIIFVYLIEDLIRIFFLCLSI